LIADAELSAERLRAEVAAVLDDSERLQAMAASARSLARPDAARAIAAEVLGAIR
jgi:UDP-N-acetylglucosamine--N-acetylmuramyl-(pentapeptide) pyrophosphoryl-undecaprenol N-acetylglucosamine transferase